MISGFHKTVKDLKHVCVLRRARHLTVQKQQNNMQKTTDNYCSLATAAKVPGKKRKIIKKKDILSSNIQNLCGFGDAFKVPCSTMRRHIFSIRNPARSGFMLCPFSQTGPPTAPDKELRAPASTLN